MQILETIFNYFSSTERLSLRRVCQRWKNIIENLPRFRKDLHLKLSGWDHHKESDFSFLIESSTRFYQISFIQIEYSQVPSSIWETICSNVTLLTFRYCLKMRLQDFHKILQFSKNVKHIQIYDHFPPLGPGYRYNTFEKFDWPLRK